MATSPTTVGIASGDFVTTTLNGAISNSATSMTIGTGLNIAAANGILQLDPDSTIAVGTDNGPETVKYTSYTSGTGAVTGLTRGLDSNTTGVAHANGCTVHASLSSDHLNNLKDLIENAAWTSGTPAATGFASKTSDTLRYFQAGKLVFCIINIAGTSNATTLTFALPVAAQASDDPLTIMRVVDDGTSAVGRLAVAAGSTTATATRTVAGDAWTNTGTKAIQGIFFYEAD